MAFRSIGAATSYASRSNTSVAAPAGIVDGDTLAIALFYAHGSAPGSPTPPSGFVDITSGAPISVSAFGVFANVFLYVKRANSESGSYSFSHATRSTQGVCICFEGHVDIVSSVLERIDDFSKSSGTGSTTTAASVDTSADATDLLLVAFDYEGSGGLTPPSGMDERLDNLIYIATDEQASAGASGSKVMGNNNGASAPWGAYLVAFSPLAAGGSDLVETVGEAIGTAEAAARPLAMVRARAETGSIAEALITPLALNRLKGEAISLGEARLRALARTRSRAEPIEATETRTTARSRLAVVADAIGIADAVASVVAATLVMVIAEAVALTEAALRSIGLVRWAAEDIGSAETSMRARVMARSREETVSGAETTIRGRILNRNRAEAVGLGETARRAIVLARRAAEALGIGEGSKGARGLARLKAEAAGIAETTISGVTEVLSELVALVSEAVAVTETATRMRSVARRVAEAVGLTGTGTKISALVRSVAEAIGPAESGLTARALIRVKAEAIGASETAVEFVTEVISLIVAAVSEAMAIAEGAVRARIMARRVSEPESIGESQARPRIMPRCRAGVVSPIETVRRYRPRILIVIRSEAVALGEIVSAALNAIERTIMFAAVALRPAVDAYAKLRARIRGSAGARPALDGQAVIDGED